MLIIDSSWLLEVHGDNDRKGNKTKQKQTQVKTA